MQTEPNGTPSLDSTAAGSDGDPPCGRLIMVSNRGPLEHYIDDTGRLQRRFCSGGVATALSALTTSTPLTWIANASSDADRRLAGQDRIIQLERGKCLRLVAPAMDASDLFYNTFCNPILWFVHHSLWGLLQRDDAERQALDAWEHGYLPVNQAFAEAVVEELERSERPGHVMLHDYHFYAAPLFIRNLRPATVLQHFIHVPWPEPQGWQQLPRPIVESICEGLLANDSVVFQTTQSVDHFVRTCEAFLPDAEIAADGGGVTHGGRTTRVWANPVSVDIWDLRGQLTSPEAETYRASLGAAAGEQTIVRVDRLDPSKNIVAGFRAFDRLLERHPEWAGAVRFLAFLVPSRTGIPEYRTYAEEVFAEVAAVNARHARPGWTPITVFHEENRLQALVALSLYDVLLVNPVADGMNLVSKEGPVLNEHEGVLVLSKSAGSYAELGEAALAVRSDDIDGTAEALHAALALPADERRQRAQSLRESVLRHDLRRWLSLLLADLEGAEGAVSTVAEATPPR